MRLAVFMMLECEQARDHKSTLFESFPQQCRLIFDAVPENLKASFLDGFTYLYGIAAAHNLNPDRTQKYTVERILDDLRLMHQSNDTYNEMPTVLHLVLAARYMRALGDAQDAHLLLDEASLLLSRSALLFEAYQPVVQTMLDELINETGLCRDRESLNSALESQTLPLQESVRVAHWRFQMKQVLRLVHKGERVQAIDLLESLLPSVLHWKLGNHRLKLVLAILARCEGSRALFDSRYQQCLAIFKATPPHLRGRVVEGFLVLTKPPFRLVPASRAVLNLDYFYSLGLMTDPLPRALYLGELALSLNATHAGLEELVSEAIDSCKQSPLLAGAFLQEFEISLSRAQLFRFSRKG